MINPAAFMKKIIAPFLFLLCISLSFCSLGKPKISLAPLGPVFPLEEASRINYEGEVTGLIQKKCGLIFFSTKKGLIYCLDGNKQEVLWKFEAGHPISASPCLGQEHIFFFDRQNSVYCLDKQGRLLWKREIQENISSELRESRGKIYFGTEKGEFLALEAATGNEIWRLKAKGQVMTEPLFWENSIIFGAGDNKLYVLNLNGKKTLTVPLPAQIQKGLFINKNFLYFGLSDKTFHCFDLSRLKEKWKIEIGASLVSLPVADEKRIFFLGSNNVLFCLKKKGGEILWWRPIPSRSSFNLEISQEKIIVSSFSAFLISFDRTTGERAGDYNAGQELRSNPLCFDSYLLINLYNSEEDTGVIVFLKGKS